MAVKKPSTKNGPKITVVVRAGCIESRDGIKGKKGETIQIPKNPEEQSPAIRHALKSGNLRVVEAVTDVPPSTGAEQIE